MCCLYHLLEVLRRRDRHTRSPRCPLDILDDVDGLVDASAEPRYQCLPRRCARAQGRPTSQAAGRNARPGDVAVKRVRPCTGEAPRLTVPGVHQLPQREINQTNTPPKGTAAFARSRLTASGGSPTTCKHNRQESWDSWPSTVLSVTERLSTPHCWAGCFLAFGLHS